MKKHLWMAAAVCLLSLASCATMELPYEERKLIAVMDLEAGGNIDPEEVNGLSAMLISSLNETGRFRIMSRKQLNKILEEHDLQRTDLIGEKAVEFGKLSGVEALVMGTVNFIPTGRTMSGLIVGEYNVDVQVVDCTVGEVISATGAMKKSGKSYRKMFNKLGKDLGKKMMTPEEKMLNKGIQIDLVDTVFGTLGISAVFLLGLGLVLM